MKKSAITVFLAFVMMLSGLRSTAYMYDIDENYELNCKNAIVMNTDTGRVVFEKDADEPVAIASLTKIMTALVVLENCKDFDEMIEAKYETLLKIGNTGLVTINLVSGEKMSVKDMVYCLLIHSAADASVVLAEHIGGSVDGFIDMMNQKAFALGMTNTHFSNTHGLDAENHFSSARDLATLSAYALKNEMFCDIVSRSSYTTAATNKSGERTVSTTNYLLTYDSGFYYEYADGIKTGYTGEAGRCLVSTAVKKDVRYVCVVLGCDAYNSNGSMACKHFSDSIYLFDKMFKKYSVKKVCENGADAAVVHVKCFGIDTDVQGVYEEDFSYLLSEKENAEIKIALDSELIKSPVAAGDKLGTCDIIFDGATVKTVNIVAKEDVRRDVTKIVIMVLIWCLAGLLIIAVIIFIVMNKKPKGGKKMKRKVKYE